LTQEQLAQARFPIGELTKPRVREIANEIGLPTANKKDSQGLCFIGKVRLPDFLQQQLESKRGTIIEIPREAAASKKSNAESIFEPLNWETADGDLVGEHEGAHYFTVGQRRGIQVGGKPLPLFVLEKNVKTNTLFVGQGEDHPGLMRSGLSMKLEETHWIRPSMEIEDGQSTRDFAFRIRYRQPLQSGTLFRKGNEVFIQFDSEQAGVAAGQFAAWYLGDECVGSGVIEA
jgi:tRNA-specific 2-thiouridylase